jgi:hypothetical protein
MSFSVRFSMVLQEDWLLPKMYCLFNPPLIASRINALEGEVQEFELLDVDIIFRPLLEGQFKHILDSFCYGMIFTSDILMSVAS